MMGGRSSASIFYTAAIGWDRVIPTKRRKDVPDPSRPPLLVHPACARRLEKGGEHKVTVFGATLVPYEHAERMGLPDELVFKWLAPGAYTSTDEAERGIAVEIYEHGLPRWRRHTQARLVYCIVAGILEDLGYDLYPLDPGHPERSESQDPLDPWGLPLSDQARMKTVHDLISRMERELRDKNEYIRGLVSRSLQVRLTVDVLIDKYPGHRGYLLKLLDTVGTLLGQYLRFHDVPVGPKGNLEEKPNERK